MTDVFAKVAPGQKVRIAAATFNAMVDAARDFRDRVNQQTRTPATAGYRSTGLVRVKNAGPNQQTRYSVMVVTGTVFSPTVSLDQYLNDPLLTVNVPSAAGAGGKLAILAEPIAPGEIGLAVISGFTVAYVNVVATTDLFADVTASHSDYLTSGSSGPFMILSPLTATGQQWVAGKIGGGTAAGGILFGKPTASFTSGATITLDPCDVHGTDNGAANVTAYVQASQASYSLTNSTSIGTGQIVPYTVGSDGSYYLVGTPVEVVTAYQVDGATLKFQKKTRNVWTLATGSESGWVDVHTGSNCAT
jgi:hypothetical protein